MVKEELTHTHGEEKVTSMPSTCIDGKALGEALISVNMTKKELALAVGGAGRNGCSCGRGGGVFILTMSAEALSLCVSNPHPTPLALVRQERNAFREGHDAEASESGQWFPLRQDAKLQFFSICPR